VNRAVAHDFGQPQRAEIASAKNQLNRNATITVMCNSRAIGTVDAITLARLTGF
jgi:hypothetical protein